MSVLIGSLSVVLAVALVLGAGVVCLELFSAAYGSDR